MQTLLRWCGSLYRARFGDLIRLLLPFVIGGIAIAHEYDRLKAWWWMWVWLTLFVGQQLSEVYLRGLVAETTRKQVNRINQSFAGAIDSLTERLQRRPQNRLLEEDCRIICVSLLARIRRYAEWALEVDAAKHRLRVTLAVPMRGAHNSPVDRVRVWCYDEPHPDRRWTEIPLGKPGAGQAFAERGISIIPDIRNEDPNGKTAFRSVLSMPVTVGGPNGVAVGVVSIDAPEPHFFTEQNITELLPLVEPVLNVIALTLLTRSEKARYAFHG